MNVTDYHLEMASRTLKVVMITAVAFALAQTSLVLAIAA